MFIETDGAKCKGHALCALVPDDYFALDDIGRIASTSGEVQQRDVDTARQGAEACPERVFILS